jgi:hypothetical protein
METSEGSDKKFWRVPKIFCFVSYLPFTGLFFDIISQI